MVQLKTKKQKGKENLRDLFDELNDPLVYGSALVNPVAPLFYLSGKRLSRKAKEILEEEVKETQPFGSKPVKKQEGGLAEIKSNIFKKYPRLENYLSDVEIRDKRSPSWTEEEGQLEFFPKGETRSPDPSKTIIELYNPNLEGEFLERAILGDMLHGLPNKDQEFTNLREKFRGSFTQPQMSMALKMYLRDKDKGPSRGFNQAFDVSILDAFIRGGLAPDERDEWSEHLTKEQKTIVKDMDNLLKQPIKKQTGGSVNVNEIYDEPLVPLAGMTQEETRQTMEEQKQRATDQQAKEDQIKEQYPILGRIPGVREMYRDPEKMPQMMSGYFTPLLGNIMDLEEIPYIYKKGKEAFKEGKYGTAALRGLEYGLAGLGGILLPISATGADDLVRQGKNSIRNVIKGLESKTAKEAPVRKKVPDNPFSESDMERGLKNLSKDEKTLKLIEDQGGLTVNEVVASLKKQGLFKKQELEQSGFLDLLKLNDTERYMPKDYQYLYNEMAPSITTLRRASDFRKEEEMFALHNDIRATEINNTETKDLINKILYDSGDINTKIISRTDVDKIPKTQERLNTNTNSLIRYLDEGVLKEPNADALKFNLRKIIGEKGHVADEWNFSRNLKDLEGTGLRPPSDSGTLRELSLPGASGSHVTHSYVYSHTRRNISDQLPPGLRNVSSHTESPNEIAYARSSKRIDKVGNKLHHIEEIQSDVLQKDLGTHKQLVQKNKNLFIPQGADRIAREEFLTKKSKLQKDWIESASKDQLRKYVAADAATSKAGAAGYFSLLKQKAILETMEANPKKYNVEKGTSYKDRVQQFNEYDAVEDLNYKDYSISQERHRDNADYINITSEDDPFHFNKLLNESASLSIAAPSRKILDRKHLLKESLRRIRKNRLSKELTDFDRKYIDEYKKIMPLEQQGMAIKEHAKIPFQDDVKDWVSHIIQDQIKVAIKDGDDFLTFTPAFIQALAQNMPRQGYKFYSKIIPSATREALKKIKQQAHQKGFKNWEPPQYFPEGNPFANIEVTQDSLGFNLRTVNDELPKIRKLKEGEKYDKETMGKAVDFKDSHLFDPSRLKLRSETTGLYDITQGMDLKPAGELTTKADINGLAFIDLRDYSNWNDAKRNYSKKQYNNAQFNKETEQAWKEIYKGPLYQNKWYSRKVLEEVPFKKYKKGGLVGINHLTRSLWQ